jgi:hypothetical protein
MSLFPAIHELFTHGAPASSAWLASSPWAMMTAGFGGAGALMRRARRDRIYRLVETLPDGVTQSEEFAAPDDATAARRARTIAEGQIELWRGSHRIAAV